LGTWILSAFGAMCGVAILPRLLPAGLGLRRAGDLAALSAGAIGLPLCTYTGVLIAGTAVPLWQGSRKTLPLLFGASGAAGAASLLEIWPPGGRGSRIVHRFGVMGKALELGLALVLEREAAAVPRVARPLWTGVSAAMWRSSQGLVAAGLLGSLVSTRRSMRRAAGVLGTLGAVMLRFALLQAGRASARDPHAAFEQQRAGRGATEVVKERDRGGQALEHGAGIPARRGMERRGAHDG
jgi:formate-dependent nitrite reductase membrane component NrfD